MPRPTWPLYVAKRPLTARNLSIRTGERFPIQDIQVIRGYGLAYGVKDVDRLPLNELDFVEVRQVAGR